MRLPGPVAVEELCALVEHLLSSLTDVLSPSRASVEINDLSIPTLIAGSPPVREIEQATAFLGGNLASSHASGFDVCALMLTLREVLVPFVSGEAEKKEITQFIEWLAVVCIESFGAARVRSVHEDYRELLEQGTPLVHIVPEVPTILLLGRTDMVVLDSILSRLLLAVVRVGAPAVIIDVTGVADPTAELLLERLGRFLAHRKVAGSVQTLVVGLDNRAKSTWEKSAQGLQFFDYFDQAVTEALSLTGYRLVRTSL